MKYTNLFKHGFLRKCLKSCGFYIGFAILIRYSEHILTFRIPYLVEPEITTLRTSTANGLRHVFRVEGSLRVSVVRQPGGLSMRLNTFWIA